MSPYLSPGDTEHYVVQMESVENGLVIACRCGEMVTGSVGSAMEKWRRHLKDVRGPAAQ